MLRTIPILLTHDDFKGTDEEIVKHLRHKTAMSLRTAEDILAKYKENSDNLTEIIKWYNI